MDSPVFSLTRTVRVWLWVVPARARDQAGQVYFTLIAPLLSTLVAS